MDDYLGRKGEQHWFLDSYKWRRWSCGADSLRSVIRLILSYLGVLHVRSRFKIRDEFKLGLLCLTAAEEGMINWKDMLQELAEEVAIQQQGLDKRLPYVASGVAFLVRSHSRLHFGFHPCFNF